MMSHTSVDGCFASNGEFREAFADMLGVSPASFNGSEWLKAERLVTPLGAMVAVADAHALHLLEFCDRRALATELTRLRTSAKGSIGVGRFPAIDQVEEELGRYFDDPAQADR